ncbi:tissue inhibitor of metalloproteinase [Ancylostoma ceylanicum]|nr:tissue inhibitor of metalloproteinase [Ancylostoma ceylanicum]
MILMGFATTAYGCSCLPSSLWEKFRRSEVVARVKVKSEDVKGHLREYTVEVVQVYKEPKELPTFPTIVRTPKDSGQCGTRLWLGYTFAIGGRLDGDDVLFMTSCDLRMEWSTTTPEERAKLDFYSLFYFNCHRNINKAPFVFRQHS